MVAHAPPAPLSERGDDLAAIARALVTAALVALFVRAFVLAAAVVQTGSMAPALLAGDRVLVDRMLYAEAPRALAALLPVREPERGDVVWLRSPLDPRVALVKRVAALPGERFGAATVPAGALAVVGDRREASLDSRQFGVVPRAALGGRVVVVLWSADQGRWRRHRALLPVR